MAQWYELAIPAVATLLGGITTGWFQSQSAERQIKAQASEAHEAREDAAGREDRARVFTERGQERERFFAERKQAYVELGEASYAVSSAGKELLRAQQRKEEADRSPVADDAPDEQFLQASAKYDKALEACRVALVRVEVVGTDRATQLARDMAQQLTMISTYASAYLQMGEEQALKDHGWIRDKFLDQARRDIEPGGQA